MTLILKSGSYMLCGKNNVQDLTVDGTMYYLRKDDPMSKLDCIDLSDIAAFSSIHVTGDLYYTPSCEMTVYGVKDACTSMADSVKND